MSEVEAAMRAAARKLGLDRRTLDVARPKYSYIPCVFLLTYFTSPHSMLAHTVTLAGVARRISMRLAHETTQLVG